MNKQAEKDRLRPLLFDGAPDNVFAVSMGRDGIWHWLGVEMNHNMGIYHPRSWLCKNQPETFLDWTDSLIEKG